LFIIMVDLEEIQDILAEASTNKGLLKAHLKELLEALMDGNVVLDKLVYKVMSAVVTLIRDGILETDGELVFKVIADLFKFSDEALKNEDYEIKKVLEEITTALFSNSCSYLQMKPNLVVQFLPYILSVMTREGSTRWAGYGCVAPLLLQNIQAFGPHVELLLKVMMHFPGEVLSVISELYKLQPEVFDLNIHLLIQLYGLSPAAQLSILHILHEIGLRNEKLVEPYLLKLRDMCDTVQSRDETVVEIQEFVEDKLHTILIESGTGALRVEDTDTGMTDDESVGTSASEEIAIDGSPSLKGPLRKRGRVFGRLTRRWFTLDEGCINFYKNSKHETPKRRIALADVVKVTTDARYPHAFVVQTRTRSVLFSASSDKEKEMWVSAIERLTAH